MTSSARPGALALRLLLVVALVLVLAPGAIWAQGSHRHYDEEDNTHVTVPRETLEGFEFRSLNFSRGGRSTAVAGVVSDPMTYYFGGTGGGVWKTENAGIDWTNVTDGYLGVGSVGAIAVADSDPNVIYVGTGSACPRGNISNGDGMYRSLDAGETWEHIGLPNAGQIGRVKVHPKDPNLIYAAVLGNIFGPNEERGVYRSKDGGETWERVLFLSDRTGFVDLSMDANNPRVIYAAAWRAERKPWTIISGSDEGGIWKTTDGGDNWTQLEGGLPEGTLGKIGVSVSPANSDRVWALIEAEGEKGGVYRSDDAGKSWRRTNGEAKLRQRPWYYTHIYADPQNENEVYVLNVGMFKSVDGGKSFDKQFRPPHGDNHDIWINPTNNKIMVQANDGGANVSFDQGESWSWQMNQATAEIYRLFVDDQWPYRVYGSQQDNSTISVPSTGRVSWNRMPPDWYSVGGCESGHIAIDPRDPNVVYAGCYGGSITRVNLKTGEGREIIAYPQLQLGQAARDLEYRFQWNAPIRLSPHDPNILYHTSQVVHRSENGGQSWTIISTDLSGDDPEQQDYSGGPISNDNTGVEVYNTIFSFEESPHRKGELWAGTDDGYLHVSRDAGRNWTEITPRNFPKGATINTIDISAHDPDRVHIAAYKYRENDFKPYIFQTNDGGQSWKMLTNGNGIPDTNFTRVVREDPVRKGLLFAGTEFGLYASFDDGANWQRFQNNLPVSPVTDMRIHRGDLVISTQGRSFWSLDDITPLRQVTKEVLDSPMWLFEPAKAYRGGGFGSAARLHYYVKEVPEEPVKIEILADGEVLRTFEWNPKKTGGDAPAEDNFFARMFGGGGGRLDIEEGLHDLRWNLRLEAPKKPRGVVHWGFTAGLAVVPGTYQVKMSSGDWSQVRDLEVDTWPTLETTQEHFEKQWEFGQQVTDRLQDLYDAIEKIRNLKGQIKDVQGRMKTAGVTDEEVSELAKAATEKLEVVENKLTQTKSKSGQDPINFPPQIDNQYVELYGYVVSADYQPPAGAYDRWDDLEPMLTEYLAELDGVVGGEVAELDTKVKALDLPAIGVREASEEAADDEGAEP